MRGKTRRGADVARRVRDLAVTAEGTSPVGDFSKQAQRLDVSVGLVTRHTVEQSLHHADYRSAAKLAKKRARRLKRGYIQPMARLAKAASPEDPEIKMADLVTYHDVIVAGKTLAEQAERNKARFVELGMREDFVDRLKTAITELEKTIALRDENLVARAKATAAIEEEFARAKSIVRVLDAMAESEWEDSPQKLAEWRTASRFAQPAKGEVASGNGSAPAVTDGAPASPVIPSEGVRPA
jgi:hypothetical protein